VLRLLQWSPALSPLAAGLVLALWPAAWVPIFGKETFSEHLSHALFLAAALLFFAAWYRDRVPGLLLLGVGALCVLIEETDYGYLYAGVHIDQALHNNIVVLWLLMLAEALFAATPFVLRADHPIRARWAPISRPAGVAVGAMLALLLSAQLSDAVVDGYPVREGADEIHDLGIALALFAMALEAATRRTPTPD